MRILVAAYFISPNENECGGAVIGDVWRNKCSSNDFWYKDKHYFQDSWYFDINLIFFLFLVLRLGYINYRELVMRKSIKTRPSLELGSGETKSL